MINRVIWIVLDSVGMGTMDDAKEYGDENANTIGNISKAVGGLKVPNLINLGLGNIDYIDGLEKSENPVGCYARFKEASNGKDTTTGHWEMGGIISKVAFPTYPNGFPRDVIEEFEKKTKRKVICNRPASGTSILDELGEEHMRTGDVIVYTSADSVFQIAAHEEIVSLDELYSMCKIARDILRGQHAVARVIARPFIGTPGNFQRTSNRRDFSLLPPYDTVLDKLVKNKITVAGVGKIEDIFSGKGITEAVHTKDNMDGVDKTLDYMNTLDRGLIFTNLVDFDMKWGHRNNVTEYAKGLEAFDVRLKEITDNMKETDVLFITADHGCDPTVEGTDHTRECVPFIAYSKSFKENINLGTRETFSDMGQTICEIFGVESIQNGKSFLSKIIK
jgi:phosphopentomutase